MKTNSVWKFKCNDKAIDLINNCICKVLVQNSSNLKLERRYYVKTTNKDIEEISWRTENQLAIFNPEGLHAA